MPKKSNIQCVIAEMGNGKTLYSTYLAFQYAETHPNAPIFSNYHLDLPNFVYKPLMVFKNKEIERECMIVVDDIACCPNQNLIYIITQQSRKMNNRVILTGQYYTQFEKRLRDLSVLIFPLYNKETKTILLSWYESTDLLLANIPFKQTYVENMDNLYGKYDTNEKVPRIHNYAVMDEILKSADNIQELVDLCFSFYPETKAEKVIKKLRKLYLSGLRTVY